MNGAGGTPGDPLAGLRDIHLPPEPGWWPPAPGWWIAAALTAAALAWLVRTLARRRRARAPRRAALRELAEIERRLAEGAPASRILADLSTFLRRAALARFPGEGVAGRTGEGWLEFLDEHGGAGAFTDGPGACLASAPYARETTVDPHEVIAVVRAWVRSSGGWAGR